MMMDPVKLESENPMLLCPFNAYHKLPDCRKYAFHVSRCGDRRGKSVYRCTHNQAHIYVDP